MTGAHRRRMDKFDREAVFFTDNAGDFPGGSSGATITGAIAGNMTMILAHDADLTQTFDDKHQAQNIKGDARDTLLEKESEIVMGAAAIGDAAVPGITSQFRMPEPRTEQNIIAKATAMHDEAAPPLEDMFINVDLAHAFRDDLIAARDAFQTARAGADSAAGQHAEAVGALDELFRSTMDLSRQRSAIVKLKYRDNPGKRAAWLVASHLEKAPQHAPTPPTPPTP